MKFLSHQRDIKVGDSLLVLEYRGIFDVFIVTCIHANAFEHTFTVHYEHNVGRVYNDPVTIPSGRLDEITLWDKAKKFFIYKLTEPEILNHIVMEAL